MNDNISGKSGLIWLLRDKTSDKDKGLLGYQFVCICTFLLYLLLNTNQISDALKQFFVTNYIINYNVIMHKLYKSHTKALSPISSLEYNSPQKDIKSLSLGKQYRTLLIDIKYILKD